MKIAIITTGFYESTLPLFKKIQKHHEVHLYCIFKNNSLNPPSFDLSKKYNGELGELSNKTIETILPDEVKKYIDENINYVKIYIYAKSYKPFIKWFIKKIQDYDYNILHFVGLNPYLFYLLPYLKNKKLFFSLHEVKVSRALTNNKSLSVIFKKMVFKVLETIIYNRKNTYFITHSKNEYNKLFKFINSKCQNITMIKFGLFDIYLEYFKNNCSLSLPDTQYFLYVGLIKKYKGIDLILNVANKLENTNIKFVIAGKDSDGIIKSLKHIPKNVVIFKRYLTDCEVTKLIANSYAVLMPYKNISQSGIPVVALLFNKPIIASNLSGLNEYLKDNWNSIFLEEYSVENLIEKIHIMRKPEIYERLLNNIKSDPFNEDLSWESIADKFINFYNDCLEN